MSESLQGLIDLCQDYTLLYVEDDEQTQESMGAILQRLFKKVYLASNGEEGITLFQNHQPDIVITDIQMPKLNGLEMAKVIKELSPTTPIIITTAFNEERYFLMAIENGVDSFLLKPIDKQRLFQILTKTVTHLSYHAKVKELERLKKVEEINRASEESIQNFSNLLPFPALFYKDNQLIFINAHAQKTFERVALESFTKETSFVSKFHLTKDKKQKIKLPTANGLNRVYWIYPNALFIGADFTFVQAYIFVDITVMEYQKLRLNAYNFSTKKSFNTEKEQHHIPHQEAMSAVTFLKNLDTEQLNALEALQELHEFAVHFSYDFQRTPNDALRAKIIEIYHCYATIMQTLPDFYELSVRLNHVIKDLTLSVLSVKQYQKLSIFLITLSEELFRWYTTLFVQQTALDIHQYDQAIIASIMHLEIALREIPHDSVGDDLELS